MNFNIDSVISIFPFCYRWVLTGVKLSCLNVVHGFDKLRQTEKKIYFVLFGQWSNILLERIAYWPKCRMDYWSVSIFFKWNIQSFGQWSNILLERIAYWPKCRMDYWSVSIFFKWNIQSLAKDHKINNNMAKFLYYQILPNTLILNLK